jgi:hypothetical protein
MDWWTYHYKKVWCFQRFVGLDSNAKEISKEEFLKALNDGGFIPIRLSLKTKRSFIISSLKSSLPQILVYKLQLQKKLLVQSELQKEENLSLYFHLDDNLIILMKS